MAKFCTNCGKELNENQDYCLECGVKLNNNLKGKRKKTPPIWLIVIVVILIICIIGSVISSSDDATNNDYNKNKNNIVTVIDFSTLTKTEINKWCNENKINCSINEEYSDIVEKDMFISQSINSDKTIYEGDKITIIFSLGKEPTTGQKNAVKKAKSYLNTLSFSRNGLIKQLEFEGFTNQEAIFGVDNCDVDWNEQAVKKAKSYLDTLSFSKNGLIKQLEFEGFTHEQAVYGVEQNGY